MQRQTDSVANKIDLRKTMDKAQGQERTFERQQSTADETSKGRSNSQFRKATDNLSTD